MTRRFPAPWKAERTPGGYRVIDATGFPLVYLYADDTDDRIKPMHKLTVDEARRIANGITRLPELLASR